MALSDPCTYIIVQRFPQICLAVFCSDLLRLGERRARPTRRMLASRGIRYLLLRQ